MGNRMETSVRALIGQKRVMFGLVFFILVGIGVPIAWASSGPDAAEGLGKPETPVHIVDVAAEFLTPENEKDKNQLSCTSLDEPAAFRHFSVGARFDGLNLTSVTRYCAESTPAAKVPNYISFLYGDCEPRKDDSGLADGGCALPLEIQTWPLCLRNPSLYAEGTDTGATPKRSTSIRGVPVSFFEDGLRAEVQTGTENVVIFATDKRRAREAAANLIPDVKGVSPAKTATAMADVETESDPGQATSLLEKPIHDYSKDSKVTPSCG